MAGNRVTGTKRKPGKKAKQNGTGSNNGLSKESAGLLARQDMAAVFREQLEKYKVTDAKIAKTIYNGLNAKLIKVFYDKGTGDIVESDPYVDHNTRLRAAEMAAKFKGYEPAKKLDIDAEIGIKNLSDEQINHRIIELLGKAGITLPVERAGQAKKKA